MPLRSIEHNTFLLLVVAVSLAFAWIIVPFYGAVLWGTISAIVFAPLYRRLLQTMPQRRTLAALATVLIIVLLVILPLTIIGLVLLQEAASVYESVQSGELNFDQYFQQIFVQLPGWAAKLLARFGLTNLGAVEQKLSAGLAAGSQFITTQIILIVTTLCPFRSRICTINR
jgi:predicted PurR-regulated permease PerM